MEVHVYGKQFINFTNDQGQTITGYNIYFGYSDKYVDGIKTNKKFVSTELGKDIVVDNDYMFYFDFNGRIQNIQLLVVE